MKIHSTETNMLDATPITLSGLAVDHLRSAGGDTAEATRSLVALLTNDPATREARGEHARDLSTSVAAE